VIGELAKRMLDPSITWYVDRAFGGYRRYATISTSNPQTIHICDDMICIPTRFSEYISWWDKSTNTLTRMFNLQEAWDHSTETNPNTSTPYDGIMSFVVGYKGYFLIIDLTDGTNKVRLKISVRYEPEPQVLILNTGSPANIAVTVNDPPSVLGLTQVYTTGTRGTGTTTISGGQYVVFATSTIPSVDSTNGVFAQSPIGSSKRFTYEAYYRYDYLIGDIGFDLYTGIKAPKDMLLYVHPYTPKGRGGAYNRGGINVSGYRDGNPLLAVYDSDPYCSQRTWAGGNPILSAVTGWGENENGNVKFIIFSTLNRKYNTKWEQRGDKYAFIIYDADLDEWFAVKQVKPIVDMYSYGQAGAVINPFTFEGEIFGAPDPSPSMGIDASNNVVSWTSPAPSTWTFYNGYWGVCNVYSSLGVALAGVAVGLWTDDTSVSMPADARNAFALGGMSTQVRRVGLQVMPFMDRTLSSGKTYLVVTRAKVFPSSVTADQFKAWATKLLPKVFSSSEIAGFLSVLPLVASGFGKPISNISVSAPSSAQPGATITVTGSAPNAPSKNVLVALVDPDTYQILTSAMGTTDASGNFSINLTIPSTATSKTYKVYAVVKP